MSFVVSKTLFVFVPFQSGGIHMYVELFYLFTSKCIRPGYVWFLSVSVQENLVIWSYFWLDSNCSTWSQYLRFVLAQN